MAQPETIGYRFVGLNGVGNTARNEAGVFALTKQSKRDIASVKLVDRSLPAFQW